VKSLEDFEIIVLTLLGNGKIGDLFRSWQYEKDKGNTKQRRDTAMCGSSIFSGDKKPLSLLVNN
jgi:hypothetical protein